MGNVGKIILKLLLSSESVTLESKIFLKFPHLFHVLLDNEPLKA